MRNMDIFVHAMVHIAQIYDNKFINKNTRDMHTHTHTHNAKYRLKIL